MHWRQDVKNFTLIDKPTAKVSDFTIKRREWCNLNRIQNQACDREELKIRPAQHVMLPSSQSTVWCWSLPTSGSRAAFETFTILTLPWLSD
ncbi:hypothetical protein Trydic_g6149 [Trypoxylus dichotomus]